MEFDTSLIGETMWMLRFITTAALCGGGGYSLSAVSHVMVQALPTLQHLQQQGQHILARVLLRDCPQHTQQRCHTR